MDSRAVSDGARRGVERLLMAGVLIPLLGGLVDDIEANEVSCVLTIIDSVGATVRSSGES